MIVLYNDIVSASGLFLQNTIILQNGPRFGLLKRNELLNLVIFCGFGINWVPGSKYSKVCLGQKSKHSKAGWHHPCTVPYA